MSAPIVDAPLRTLALCILIYVGARMVTNLVTRRPIRPVLLGMTAIGIGLAVISGGSE